MRCVCTRIPESDPFSDACDHTTCPGKFTGRPAIEIFTFTAQPLSSTWPLAENENAGDKTFSQLGLDSLDAMEVSLQVEQHFGFTGESVPTSPDCALASSSFWRWPCSK